MPFVSIVVPTMRVGGINTLLDGLAAQDFTDLELILVDGIKQRRAERVAQEAADRFLLVRHVEPHPNPFPIASYCAYANAGLIAASGEVVLFLVDYTRVPPGLVGAHAAFHHQHRGQAVGMMAPHRYVDLAVDPEFPRFAQSDVDAYEDHLRAGTLDRWMVSIGQPRVDAAQPFAVDGGAIAKADADPKLRMQAGPVAAAFFHCKNESVRLEDALAVNGFDEDLDGTHGWQDSDFADRLAVVAGVRFHLDPSQVAEIASPRHVFPFARRLRDFRTNEGIWYDKRARGYPTPNRYILRDRREHAAGQLWQDSLVAGWTSCTLPLGRALQDESMGTVEKSLPGAPAEMRQAALQDVNVAARNALHEPGRRLRLAMVYGEFSTAFRQGGLDVEGLYTRVGLTGSESSFFNLARTLVERGHYVVAFCQCTEPYEHPSGLKILPIQELPGIQGAGGINAVVAWNEPDYLHYAPPGALRVVDQQLNDWGYCGPGWYRSCASWLGGALPAYRPWRELVDLYVFPSRHSMQHHMVDEHLGAQVVQCDAIPNSVDLDLFRGPRVEPRPLRVAYCSSPDRGLHHLLDWWPEVRRRVPQAELHVYYRLDPWLARAQDMPGESGHRALYIRAALPRLAQHGVVVRGPVASADMARELAQARVLAYPCDPIRYTEGFGCSVLDACAAACLPIISDADALPSVHGAAAGVIEGRPGEQRAAWVDRIAWALTEFASSPQAARVRAAMAAHAQAHDRHRIADQWEHLLSAQIGRRAASPARAAVQP